MKLVYRFSALTAAERRIDALIDAESVDFAFNRIRRMGFSRPVVRLDLVETIKSWLGVSFDPRELGRFYSVLGARTKTTGDFQRVLEDSPELILDKRLRSAAAMFAAGVEAGTRIDQAMSSAGFDSRDSMIVHSMYNSGKVAQAFEDLGEEVTSRYLLTQTIAGTMRTVKMMSGFFYLFLPVLIWKIAPNVMRFFEQTGQLQLQEHLPGFITSFYDFAGWCNANPAPALAVYVVIPILVAKALRSKTYKRLLDQLPVFKRLNEVSEHAAIWGTFGIMFGANIGFSEICESLSKTAKREEVQVSLLRASALSRGGASDSNAVAGAGFTEVVAKNFASASKSGDLSKGLGEFAKLLKSDASFLGKRLAQNVEWFSLLLMALMVLALFMVTVYPITVPLIEML